MMGYYTSWQFIPHPFIHSSFLPSFLLPLHYQNAFVPHGVIRLAHTSPKRSVKKLPHEQLLAVVANCTMASPSFLSIGGSFRVASLCAAERMPLIEREADYPSGTSMAWRCFAFALLIFAVLKSTSSLRRLAQSRTCKITRQNKQTAIKVLFLLRSSRVRVRAWWDVRIFLGGDRVRDHVMLWEGVRRSCFLLSVQLCRALQPTFSTCVCVKERVGI